eukprot:TRINITY_DN3804_c0_g3_i1.p1 TRINITY_DN3804_c0_g3~~TRINITY_DN3804_c0_g3_i1.p1  ORF type:complete len:518 (+),score=177.01 TRINITY_DN3804_c0_g3_i1:1497-3050(+)
MCNTKQSEMRRLCTAANHSAGSGYEKALEAITLDPEIAAGLGKEDLYTLVGTGLSEEWVEEAVWKIFVKKTAQAEEEGFGRSLEKLRAMCKGLGYAYEVMGEGLQWLRRLKILKDEPLSKEGNPDISWNFASLDAKEMFRVKKSVEYPDWMMTLAFSKTKKGAHLARYMFGQGQECREKASAKTKKSKDVEEAGKRSVCQYLQWLFPPPEGWKDVQGLYAGVPEKLDLRKNVLEAIATGAVFGAKWEVESAPGTVYNLEDEKKLGVPLERDCGGEVPEALIELGKERKRVYITRQVRALKMNVQIGVEIVPEEGEEAERKQALSISPTEVYNVVEESNSFVCPSVAAVVGGLEYLWNLDDGDWEEKKAGVDLVWLNVPLPRCLVTDNDVAQYDPRQQKPWETSEVMGALELAKGILTPAGVLVVVAPVGFPESALEGTSYTGIVTAVRSTVTLIMDFKKSKDTTKHVYGCRGNTFHVYYVTVDGSDLTSMVKGSAWRDTLTGVPFHGIKKAHGSYKP